jgi:hypothetical protein
MQFGVRRRLQYIDAWYVFRLAMMERLAKERITGSIVSLLRYVL